MTFHKTAKMLAQSTRGRSNAAVYLGGHHVLGTTIFGDPVIIDSRSFRSLKLFYLPSPSNIAILSFLYHSIRPGMACADIGAECGYLTSVLAELVGCEGHVYSFENDADRFDLLERNILTNDYTWAVYKRNLNDVNLPALDFAHISSEEDLPDIFSDIQSVVESSPRISLICHINPKSMQQRPAKFDDCFEMLHNMGFEGYLFPTLDTLESKEQLQRNHLVKSILLRL